MQGFSENQIRTLYTEFRNQKKYISKLSFFDRVFGIIPFPFPEFDPSLGYFFQEEKTRELTEIYKKERNNPGLTEKKFSFGETFTFNIKPANSNSSSYSGFILSRFLSRAPNFEVWIEQKRLAGNTVEFLLDQANGIVNKIECRLQYEYDKSFKLQCMSVFYRGFFDAFTKEASHPGKKRKFIELYLYAQGIIYAHYIRTLKSVLHKPRAAEPAESKTLDFSGKIALLTELGVIDYLRKKFARMDPFSFENKIAEIIRLITGEIQEPHAMLNAGYESGVYNPKSDHQ
jgi:hypothetical protein